MIWESKLKDFLPFFKISTIFKMTAVTAKFYQKYEKFPSKKSQKYGN